MSGLVKFVTKLATECLRKTKVFLAKYEKYGSLSVHDDKVGGGRRKGIFAILCQLVPGTPPVKNMKKTKKLK